MNAISTAVLNGMIAGILITLSVWLLLRLDAGRLFNAATRCVIWCVLLVLVAAAPLLYIPAGRSSGTENSTAKTDSTELLRVRFQVPAPDVVHPETTPTSPYGRFPIEITSGNWTRWFVLAWAVTASFMLLRLVLSYVALEFRKAGATYVSSEYSKRLQSRLKQCGVHRKGIRFGVSEEIPTPMAAGFYRPAILIPNRVFKAFSESEIDQVWLHEAAHLKRRDDLALTGQRLIEALFPFNPAIHWIARRIELEREIACDDVVIAATGEARPYAMCLTRVAELAGTTSSLALGASATRLRSHLERRVEMLLDNTRNTRTRLLKRKLSAAIALLLAAAGVAAGIPHPFVIATPSPAEIVAQWPLSSAVPAKPSVASPAPVVPAVVYPRVSPTPQVEAPTVLLPVVVTDPQGRYVSGLEAGHFQLFEDQVEQTIIGGFVRRQSAVYSDHFLQ